MENNKRILINFTLYFLTLLLIIIVGISNVFALEYTDIGYVHTLSGVNGQVTIDVTYETESGAPLTINRNQVIYTQLKVMNVFISNYSFEANRQYQIEMEFPYQQLQYANTYQVFGANNELCLLNYSNSIFNSQWPRWNFSCPHSTNEIYLKVYNSNNTAITSYGDWSWNYMYMRYTNTSIDSDITDTDSITNNANQNADRIINNQNQNTQDIINSNKVCNKETIKNASNVGYLSSDGSVVSDNNWKYTDYIRTDKLTLYSKFASEPSVCYYNDEKTLISCKNYGSLSNGLLTLPSGTKYFRASIYINANLPNYNQTPYFKTEYCDNGNQALNDNINDDDTTGAINEASDFFSSFTTNTFGLTSIITAPLNLIRSVLSSTCTTLQLPLPYLDNKKLELPCMSTIYSQFFGSFFTIYQTITYGIIAYWVCVRIFNQVKDFKNPEHDEIEVMDL